MFGRIVRGVILTVVASAALSGVVEAESPTPFTKVVRAHFSQWSDAKGEITPDKLDHLMKQRSIQGEDAAAVAVMKRNDRDKTTKSLITWKMEQVEQYEAQVAKDKKQNNYDKAFKRALAAIKADPHTLFAKGAPHLDSIRQARSGDCWLLAAIGAIIVRNPNRMKSLITDDGDHRYTVHFAYHSFKVNAPTDAEIGAYANDASDGDWLYVVENAEGQYRQDFKHLHHVSEANDDALVAGMGKLAFQDILGRNADHIAMSPTKPQDDLVRESLTRAFKLHRLVTVGTTHDKAMSLPHGIAEGHEMAVIGWNASTQTVKIWNPWGNSREPKATGEDPGFKTVKGVFEMPLSDFTRSFAGMDIENGKPYKLPK